MQTLENKVQSLFPELSLFIIDVSQDILANPAQYPEITSTTELNIQSKTTKAPSGWSLPSSHYLTKFNQILKQSKDTRYLIILQKYLEQHYLPIKKNEPFIEIYNLLRQGNLPTAVSSLTASNLQLHAAMLTGYQTLLGLNSLELDIKEWLSQAKNFSQNKKYPFLERAVFGVISGNAQPLRDWLGTAKTDLDEAWICTVNGIRESLIGGSPRSWLAQALQFLNKNQFDGFKLISGDIQTYLGNLVVEFNKFNEVYDANSLIQQRKIALISVYFLSILNQIPQKTTKFVQIVKDLNIIIEIYVRQILNQQNSQDAELVPYFIFNLENMTSIQLILVYLKANNNYQQAIDLAEECLQKDTDSIMQFRFLAIQQLSEFFMNQAQLQKLSQLAIYGRFPLSANISFVYLLFICRNLIQNEFNTELDVVVRELEGILQNYRTSIQTELIEEFNIISCYSAAVNSQFVELYKSSQDKQKILQTFSEMQNFYFTTLNLIKTGSFLIQDNQGDIQAIEEIFNTNSRFRQMEMQSLITKVISASIINIAHSLFIYSIDLTPVKRNQYLHKIVEMCDFISDETSNLILLDAINKESLGEFLMVVEKTQICLMCQQ